MENKTKSLADKIQENTNNEVSYREKMESNNEGPAVGDADKVRKSSIVSSYEVTLCRPRPQRTVNNNTEKDENDLDERTASVGPKGSDKVASNHEPNNGYDGITNVQVSGLVDGIEPNESDTTGSNGKTVHQYDKTTLRSRKKTEGNSDKGENDVQQSSSTRSACFTKRK